MSNLPLGHGARVVALIRGSQFAVHFATFIPNVNLAEGLDGKEGKRETLRFLSLSVSALIREISLRLLHPLSHSTPLFLSLLQEWCTVIARTCSEVSSLQHASQTLV